MRRFALVVPLVCSLFFPQLAAAQTLAVNVGAFGSHESSGTTVSLTTQPIGIDECDEPIPLTFSNITLAPGTYFIDIWSASSAGAMCGLVANRTGASPSCTHVTVPATVNRYTGGTTFQMNITPVQLFGSCTSGTRTFFFFDTTSSPNTSDPFTNPLTVDIVLDADVPDAPVVAGDVAGDTSFMVSWTNPTNVAPQGGARVYFDPNGCGGDGGTSALVAGAAPPSTYALQQLSTSISNVTVTLAQLGWTSSTYGDSGALAVTVLDSARNESVLSNVVCVERVQVSGFWNTYCAERGLTVDQCTEHYRGCSVAVPSRRVDFAFLAVLSIALGMFVRRRSR